MRLVKRRPNRVDFSKTGVITATIAVALEVDTR